MDPVSAVVSIWGVVTLCAQVSKSVTAISGNANDRTQLFELLKLEVDALHRVATSIMFKMQGRRAFSTLWTDTRRATIECGRLLTRIDVMLGRNRDSSLLRRFIGSETESREISSITNQIAGHRKSIELSLTTYLLSLIEDLIW